MTQVDIAATDDEEQPDRYSRQVRFEPIGQNGQRRIANSVVAVLGMGALGTHVADLLARAGVGTLRIVDRDFVELSNLQRQTLFNESDADNLRPKAIAAAEHLTRVNSQIAVDPRLADITYRNIADHAADCDVLIDGSDNFELRMLVNDYSICSGTPWVFGGVLGSTGQAMTIVPGRTACLACVMEEPPELGAADTCDSVGVLGPAVAWVAAVQAAETLKILSGNVESIRPCLSQVDLWRGETRQISTHRLVSNQACNVCGRRHFDWLSGQRGSTAAVLCGRNAVLLRPAAPSGINLPAIADRLAKTCRVVLQSHLLRAELAEGTLTLFCDGRCLVAGVDSEAAARAVVSRWIGS